VLVVQALAGAQVEAVLVHRRGHERDVVLPPHDPLGQHRVPVERVVVGQGVDRALVDPEDRHRLTVHQRDHPSLDEEARYYAKLGEEELLRVAHITRQTLGFYRESRHPVQVSISGLLDEILELQTRRMEFSSITLQKHYRSRGTIQGFPVELKQVFLNLIGNAVQAMPKGGTMRLHVFEPTPGKKRRPSVCISICDTGTGIDPIAAKHLFEPFFTTKSTKGTGLGLWISKGIVQKYGGSIRFRALSLSGRNVTCFQVMLPDVDHQKIGEPFSLASSEEIIEGSHGR